MEWWQILLILLGSIVIGVSVGVLIIYLLNRFVLKRDSGSATTFLSHIMEPLIRRRAAAPALEKPPEYRTPNLAKDVPAKREATPVVEEPSQPSAPDLARDVPAEREVTPAPEKPPEYRTSDLAEDVPAKHEAAPLVEEPFQPSAPDLARDVPVEREVTPAPEKPPPYRTSYLDEDVPAKHEAAPVVEEPFQPSAPDLFSEIESNLGLATELWTGKLLPFQTTMWDTRRDAVDKLSPDVREAVQQAYTDIQLANNIVRLSTEYNYRTDTLDESYQKLCATITERINRIKLIMEQSRK